MVVKTFRYRIYPSRRQVQCLNNQLLFCCELYNAAIQERRDAYRFTGKSISRFDQIYQLPEIRANREEIASINFKVLEDVIARVDGAFQGFFSRVRKGQKAGYPRFRSFRRYDSITFREIGNALNGNKLRLSKIGHVRINLHRAIEGTVKTLTIKREAGRWFAAFVCQVEPSPLPFSNATIGVDVGLTAFATLSDGTMIDNPRWYRHGERTLRVAQRRIARRKKGSNHRHKAIVLLQRAHVRVRSQRADFHHKLARSLVNQFGLIAVEDLNVKGLTRMRLAKSVHDAGWSAFITKLCAKAEEAARIVVKVDPRGTSQICLCGAKVRKTLKDRLHICLSCGLSANRDHVSAQVILGRGLRLQDLTGPVAASVS